MVETLPILMNFFGLRFKPGTVKKRVKNDCRL
jgi:hypothetical protein